MSETAPQAVTDQPLRQLERDGVRYTLLGTAHGALYRLIESVRNDIPEGFEIGVYDFDPDSREGDAPVL